MNVVLIGFMGCGKTVVGRKLAKRLGYYFADTDELIEFCVGKSIPDIFAEEGEASFRAWERKLLEHLGGLENHVLATGGGLPVPPGNFERLQKLGQTVFINPTKEVLLQRLENGRSRPLLSHGNLAETISRLWGQRFPIYNQSSIVVDTSLDLPHEAVSRIIRALVGRKQQKTINHP